MVNHIDQNYRIRRWQPADRETAAQIIKQVLAEYNLPWQPTTADIDVLEVEKYYLQVGGEFWVVEDTISRKIVATAAYYPISRGINAVEIRKMYILPTHRGKGLGKYLLTQLEQTIIDRGYQQIWIETASILTQAVALYEKYDYQPTEGVETDRCDRIYYKNLS